MLIYALLAAAVVVIAAMTVATGGAALIALGALAGLAGAAWGAVVGSMLCGHLGAKIRKWVEVPKANKTVIQGITQVTGDFKMTCMIPGGIVTFNPKIKSWNQAIALGASNYLGKLMEGMMAGAAVGMAGALWAGGASAFTSGGIRGIGQAAWQFAKSCPMNIVKNIAASFGYAGAGASTTAVWTTVGTAVGLRTATATQAGLGHYGNTGESGWGAAGTGVFAMETGMYESGQNMAGSALGWKKEDGTGYSTSWQDVAGMAMLLSPVHKAPEELTSKTEPKNKVEESVKDGEGKKTDKEQTVRDGNVTENQDSEPAGEREAFEMNESVRVTPESLGIGLLKDSPILLDIYHATLEKMANSPKDNIYKRYIEAKNNNFEGMTREQIQKMCTDVWKNTRKEFGKEARSRGITIEGEVHHWNYPKYDNPHDVLNPNQLTEPVSRDVHQQAHEQTTSDPSKIWEGPISNDHAIVPEPYNLPQPRPISP
ncbi:hypothetical protein [Chryseobacterium sp. ERMR1:04]|uniref:hypothetical protein n=1 Tax=Chryseobacterium sp. ERMR1:04 TaxID=1705393 RepID=UPI000F4ED9A5|nr:hypothetical protein [Chryseobacterium sp. ERMR1:04]